MWKLIKLGLAQKLTEPSDRRSTNQMGCHRRRIFWHGSKFNEGKWTLILTDSLLAENRGASIKIAQNAHNQ
ncbi:Uncharacterised protein [Vibrio cholerae]|nr:Uncharacterised protein [Vibrio cholerae]CSI07177.1 Uncharacterised protein [Vibrio cholerae]